MRFYFLSNGERSALLDSPVLTESKSVVCGGAACTVPIAAQPPCEGCALRRVIKIITSAGAKHLRRSGIRWILKNRPGPRRGGG